MKDINLVRLVERFHSEDECRAMLEEIRWPEGVECPRCGSQSISRVREYHKYDCNACRYNFTVTAGTIFHDTHLPLWKWFAAIYFMLESKKGVSANQLKRTLGVSYKTAWYLCHRIRKAMSELNAEKLSGSVEVDETFVGGKVRGKGRHYLGNKAIVIGVVQRGGSIRLQVVDKTDRKTLHDFIKENTTDETAVIYTDDYAAYRGIAGHNTRHEVVNHSKKEWVRGDAHTNEIEGVWATLKRSVTGTFHKISIKHLDAYLDEIEWKYNQRENPYLFRDTLRKMVESAKLEFKNLVAE